MKTKLQFRVFDKKNKKHLKGFEQANKHFLGIGHDYNDNTILCIAFDSGEPDDYYEIQPIKNGENK